ncbi:DnaB-like helicase N-terminal domain-containing protein [Microbulbifer epialgicus]|uniref:DnaB-like helicase N-terminal domain-containing protein n=1 Tax=Microbulbifer epialgicus TaxID=393907 RepID=A0ABV4NTR6_9GAMM
MEITTDGNTANKVNSLPQPHSLEAERFVLGGLISDPDRIDAVTEQLDKEDFFSMSHRNIFAVIREMKDDELSINIDSLAEALDRRDLISQVGGPAYLESLVANTLSAAHIVSYAKIVSERSTLRQMITAAG